MSRTAGRPPRRRAAPAAAAAAALALAGVAGADAVRPGEPGSGATATRSVAEYQLLEQRLADLLAHRDRAALELLLDSDFAAFGPERREPADAATFLDAELAHPQPATIDSLAVLERGEFDLVSFLVRREPPAGGPAAGRLAYVVDVWRRAGHRLVARYRAEPRLAPPLPRTPSGRD